jgi:hypothetical protein
MQPVTCAGLLYFIHSEYALDISAEALRRGLERDQRIRTCPGRPMETHRVQVTNEAPMEYFLMLPDAIDDIPATFIWNMDEIGHSDWADAHREAVYVPHDISADHIPVTVSRTGKRSTLVGCICLDGSFMKRMVVIPRHKVDEDLPLLGVSEWNCHICHQSSGFTNRELFDH